MKSLRTPASLIEGWGSRIWTRFGLFLLGNSYIFCFCSSENESWDLSTFAIQLITSRTVWVLATIQTPTLTAGCSISSYKNLIDHNSQRPAGCLWLQCPYLHALIFTLKWIAYTVAKKHKLCSKLSENGPTNHPALAFYPISIKYSYD
jgi:hypothetical protein